MNKVTQLREITKAEHAKPILIIGLYLLIWQLLAGLLYATQWYVAAVPPQEIHIGMVYTWEFWWFWDDYWIFMEYLSWPGINGTYWAIRANAISAALAYIIVFTIVRIQEFTTNND